MKRRNVYTVNYMEHDADYRGRSINVIASNKEDAYVEAMNKLGWCVYAAWVTSVTYNNGNERQFNTFAGKPY